MGMFFAAENGADLLEYHKLMYKAAIVDRVNLEDAGVLAECVKNILNAEEFKLSLESGKYAGDLDNANDYAYEKNGVWIIPAYRMNGKKLDSKGGVGITKEQLALYLIDAVVR